MKLLGKLAAFLLLLLTLIVFFLPKQSLYYEAEKLLKDQRVILSGEHADDTGLQLVIEGGALYYEDLKVAELSEITLTPWFLFNRIAAAPFTLSKEMSSFLPPAIDSVSLQYTVFDPLHVTAEAAGAFGTLSGKIGLADRRMVFDLNASKQLLGASPFWLRQFKKTSEGVYRYESAY